jgi:flagellar basal body-associated protein FliL
VLEVGIKTSCSLGEECVSGLVDNNGVCIKSEVQRLQEAAEAVAIRTATLEANAAAEKKAQEERDKQMRNMLIIVYLVSFVGVLAVVVIAVFGYLYWKKLENEKIKAEMQKAVAQIESKEEKIRELDDRIDSLFQDYRLRKAELETATRDRANRLAGLEMEYERRKKELEEQKKNMDKQVKAIKANWKRTNKPFPYELVGNRKVIINPDMGGYYCFYDERTPLPKYPPSKTCHNRLVHRWIWENHHGRKVRVGYHIHHRDEDKYNNSIENLEEIDGDEHFALHRKKYDNG